MMARLGLRFKSMVLEEPPGVTPLAVMANREACQSLLLKMRDEGMVKFDIHSGLWLIG